MAIDTQDRRGSVVGMGLVPLFPVPTGTFSQGDRQQITHLYRGLLAQTVGGPVGAITVASITLQP